MRNWRKGDVALFHGDVLRYPLRTTGTNGGGRTVHVRPAALEARLQTLRGVRRTGVDDDRDARTRRPRATPATRTPPASAPTPVAPPRTRANASRSCSQRWIAPRWGASWGSNTAPDGSPHDHALPDRLAEQRQRAKHEGVGKSPGQLARAPRREHDRAHGA